MISLGGTLENTSPAFTNAQSLAVGGAPLRRRQLRGYRGLVGPVTLRAPARGSPD